VSSLVTSSLAASVHAWTLAPDRRKVAVQVEPTLARVFELERGELLASYAAPEPIRGIAWMGAEVVVLARDQNPRDLYLTSHRCDDPDPLGLADLPDFAGVPLWFSSPDAETLSLASASAWRSDGRPAPRGGLVVRGADLGQLERLYVPGMPIRVKNHAAMQSLAVLDASAKALVVLSDPDDGDLWVAAVDRAARQSVAAEIMVPYFGCSDVLRFRSFAVADGTLLVTGWRRPLGVSFTALVHVGVQAPRVVFGGVDAASGDHAIVALSIHPRGDALLVQQLDLHAPALRVTHVDLGRGVATTLLESRDFSGACAAAFAPDGSIDTLVGGTLGRRRDLDASPTQLGEVAGCTALTTLVSLAGGWLIASEGDDGRSDLWRCTPA
jgi:hypothetical protein